jgi:hypothetical protein
LKENSDGIINALDKLQVSRNRNILIIIDQFEELFRYRIQGKATGYNSDQSTFLNILTNVLISKDLNIHIVIAIRPDYISECSQYKEFTHIINNSNFLIPQMSRENLREVIEAPLRLSGEKIESELVETILNDVSTQTDPLIILQHAMMRTWACWEELNESERPLGYSDYHSIGTMDESISRHADEVYNNLTRKSKDICERLFKIITTTDQSKRGITRPSKVEILKNMKPTTKKLVQFKIVI